MQFARLSSEVSRASAVQLAQLRSEAGHAQEVGAVQLAHLQAEAGRVGAQSMLKLATLQDSATVAATAAAQQLAAVKIPQLPALDGPLLASINPAGLEKLVTSGVAVLETVVAPDGPVGQLLPEGVEVQPGMVVPAVGGLVAVAALAAKGRNAKSQVRCCWWWRGCARCTPCLLAAMASTVSSCMCCGPMPCWASVLTTVRVTCPCTPDTPLPSDTLLTPRRPDTPLPHPLPPRRRTLPRP